MSHSQFDPFAEVDLTAEPSPGVSERVRRECTEALEPVSRMQASVRWLLTIVVTLVGSIALFVLHPNGVTPHLGSIALGLSGWGAVLLALTIVGLVSPPGRRLARPVRLVIAGAIPLAFWAYLAARSATTGEFAALNARSAIQCGLMALGGSGLLAAAIMTLWRRTDPLHPGVTGALVALCGSLAAGVAIGSACPNRELWHLWLGHGIELGLIVGLGALVGRKWLAP